MVCLRFLISLLGLGPVLGLGQHAQRNDHLVEGSPESVGMHSSPLEEMIQNVTAYTKPANYGDFSHNETHPIEPGSVTLIAREGTIVSHFAVGKRNLYADINGTKLQPDKQEDATLDTIYDMASLTKLFTTIAALRQIDARRIELDATVASYVPEFAVNGKENITIQQLLTHTSGFDADPTPSLASDSYTTHDERIKAIVTQKIINPPGTTFLYSDLSFMTMMVVLETVTGQLLDDLVHEYTSLLDMTSTFFNRGNIEGHTAETPCYPRVATQEFQIAALGPSEPKRPQPIRGTVHDENAWALGGVSGHAGLFSTARDTAAFCQMILNNGTYGGNRILSQEVVDFIFHNFVAPPEFSEDDAHGLGFELNQYYTAGPLASILTASHTGYTGTSLVIDRGLNLFYLHFANRVHPSREWSNNNIVREAVGYWVGKGLGLDVTFPPM